VEASTRKTLRPAGRLARHVLLPPLLAVVAVLCMLLAVVLSFGQHAKKDNPLATTQQQPSHDALARQVKTKDLEGTLTPADIRRAQKPLSERRRLLAKHPYFFLYTIAKERFDVSIYLVAAVHYQETGFNRAPAKLGTYRRWTRNRNAFSSVVRPARYPHETKRHPSLKDDFDVVMAIAQGLKRNGARGLGGATTRAVGLRYGSDGPGRLAAAMVLERARAWRLLGTLPLPGRGELATPAKGVVGGCGYFGCPRPGHLHNGVDFLAPTGTPIHAADAGVIASVQSPGQSGGYGNFVCIQHRPHLASCYAHMSAFAANVRPGAHVKRGQVIGLVGSTGSSTAPHLHFEVRRGPAACQACAVDPLPLLSGEVPDAALPKMAASAPVAARAASAGTGVPVAAAVAPPVVAPVAPAATADAVPDPPIDATTAVHNRSATTPATTGGSRTTPAPAPASRAPATQAPAPVPAPSPPHGTSTGSAAAPTEQGDTGTGGATPDFSSPPPASSTEAAAPAPGG
jgi:murein DD-endopeptidase MepM/ murein hydrolase activator NlpD